MKHRMYLFFILFLGICLGSQAAVPNVVVTIKPIHSLVCGVMAGLKPPILLMSGEGSPHTQPLEPNQVRQITAAKVIVWVGPSYEAPLQGIMKSHQKGQHVITLLEKPGMILYPLRQGGSWGSHTHGEDNEISEKKGACSGHNHGDHTIPDGHLWLDPRNAKAIVLAIATELETLDPQHAQRYRKNAEMVLTRLENLDQELKLLLKGVVGQPYVVYHDGTQYFDRHFQTKAIGVLIGDGHYGINAQHFLQVSEYIRVQKVRCIFTEPQFPTDKIYSLADETGTRIETLDYLGVHLKADRDAYFTMMRNLSQAFIKGLSERS
jgi:zinc transport system substrate-binding protein